MTDEELDVEAMEAETVDMEPEPEPQPRPEPERLPHQQPGVTAQQFLVARKIPVRRWGGFLPWAKKNYGNQRFPVSRWMELFQQYGKTPVK